MKHLIDSLHQHMSSLSDLSAQNISELLSHNTNQWIASVLRISGSNLSRSKIIAMACGENIREATINDYQMMEICRSLLAEFEYMIGFDSLLDIKIITRLHQILTEAQDPSPYRNRNLFVDEMVYPAPGPARIPALMRTCELEISSEEHQHNKLMGAIRTHDMLMSIWPFPEKSDVLAYICMSYELLKAGYLLPSLDITREDHLKLSAEFTDKGSSKAFTEILINSLIEEITPYI